MILFPSRNLKKKQYNLHLFYLFNLLTIKHLKINGFKKIVQLRRGVCVCGGGGGGGNLHFNVFFERAICSRHVETSRREEEMGPVLAPTVRVTISTLLNLPLS